MRHSATLVTVVTVLLVSALHSVCAERPFTASQEYRIKKMLLERYDRSTRPVKNDSTAINIKIAISLYHILDTDEKFQTIQALLSIRLRWRDEHLTWNQSEYGRERIWVPANQIWVPDVVINNNADDSFAISGASTNAIVSSDGSILWMYPAVIKTYCTLNVRYFPFDAQQCEITFISWTYSGFELNLTDDEEFKNINYYRPENQEWLVNDITSERHVAMYACCAEPYPDVTITLHLKRRSLFYIYNLVFPCILIYLASLFGFFLPVESGEKVNLEITILLALVVFLMFISQNLPPTPDAIPFLDMILGVSMTMIFISLVMAVLVTNVYFKKDSNSPPPKWIMNLLRRCKRGKKRRTTNYEMSKFGNGNAKYDLDEFEGRSLSPPNMKCGWCGEDGKQIIIPNCHEEWTTLARLLDRLFFWVFFITSSIAFTTVFCQIPRELLL
ncbi:neuronal acetylcholine receptor subunit alpha-9 [Lingula anatina]|uniref:Neuronal acetylcholine receptor subunit alpha-9 n=1 Tax=Lingula anatina TaxID=7574 RepID=A0A1S3JB11_LINAN|nr:neuronal acetylcholine receptor subunit alpha-9 [Lingula anatina]|eukprot:XP_013407587.1 neuronal acetylcholine receptor subunit alpha-9 [Lingula anatina]